MAINTAAKRASVLSYALVTETLIVPSATVPQADQQTINHLYGGILAALPAVSTGHHNSFMYSIGKWMNR